MCSIRFKFVAFCKFIKMYVYLRFNWTLRKYNLVLFLLLLFSHFTIECFFCFFCFLIVLLFHSHSPNLLILLNSILIQQIPDTYQLELDFMFVCCIFSLEHLVICVCFKISILCPKYRMHYLFPLSAQDQYHNPPISFYWPEPKDPP